ncbi:hypothetical protein GGI19_003363 [Coemansia pectinata]|uniref:LITAF domain-containing protein n=1 Tax=Coemansia pectinata TaxID=1052879 RepID=A0A9W8GUD5_9FUNG|nr:hypothetical protein GGI19_003363 [Coemansia pectinata]
MVATTEDLVVVTMVAIVAGTMVAIAAGIMVVIAVVTTVDMASKATMVAMVVGIMEAIPVGASMEDLMEVSMEGMVAEEVTMADMVDMAAEEATMEDMAHVDKQFTKSMVSIAHDPHGMFKSDGRGFMGHSGARARVGSKSVPTICPRCQSQIVTLVKRRPDAKNALATAGAVALSLILDVPKALLPLALLPMQLKSLHKISHYCPRCNYKLGKNIKISIPMDEYHD